MQVSKIFINGIEIVTLDKPIMGEDIKLSLDRDFTYSSVDTKIDIEVKFFCASGKPEIDAAYDDKGIEAVGELEIIDTCGTQTQSFRFKLDFKNYNNKGNYTTLGIIDLNSKWKEDLNKEVNIDKFTNGTNTNFNTPFWVRNLQLEYRYFSEKLNHQEKAIDYIYDYDIPVSGTATDFFLVLYPKTKVTINELETGNELLAETLLISSNTSGQYIELNNIDYFDSSGAIASRPSFLKRVPDSEPEPIFENTLDDGTFTIGVTGSIGVQISFNDNYELDFRTGYMQEIVLVGTKWGSFSSNNLVAGNPLCGYIKDTFPIVAAQIVTQSNAIPLSPLPYTFNFSSAGSHSITASFPVKKGEKVWIINQFHIAPNAPSNTVFKTNSINYELSREYEINFQITKKTATVITSSTDVEPYHTETTAYYGQTILNHIFNTIQNFGQTECYSDLWFSRGQLLRNKINKSDFIVKPKDFFRELEKVVCCGIGYFYDTVASGEKRIMSVYDFYTDKLVPSQYQFDETDLIDGTIEIAPFLSPYYKDINIGYAESKDTPRDLHKQNNYSIDNASESTYSKVSDFIASQYVITKALRLGTEDKELEYDNNVFILSGGQLGIYNATLSQSIGVLSDEVFVQPNNFAGINRRYATVFNLFRHLYKWGFSLYKDKNKLSANKYVGTAGTFYDYKIGDNKGTMAATSAPNKADSYWKLSKCYLPKAVRANVDKSIETIFDDYIRQGLHVPSQITFKTGNLSTFDLIAMREFQYDLFSVTDGTNTYYGNLISADLENDVTTITLLRRFKNGI